MAQVLLRGTPFQTQGELPALGESCPDVGFTANDLSDFKISDFQGQRLVLNIFPSIDTPTCALSVRRFNEAAASLENTQVLCISADLPFAQSRFCGAEGLEKVKMASTFRSDAGSQLGVVFIEGPLRGLLSRAVLVLNEQGQVIHAEQVEETAQEPDYDAALAVL